MGPGGAAPEHDQRGSLSSRCAGSRTSRSSGARLPSSTGVQVALFRVLDADGEHVHAVDNLDPACGAPVIARGIVGTAEDRWFVASPMYKHRYDLRTGSCLTDPALTLRTHAVELLDGTVHVRRRAVTGEKRPRNASPPACRPCDWGPCPAGASR
jgi:NAD(P)H-dependent nitrite reductase small subunit